VAEGRAIHGIAAVALSIIAFPDKARPGEVAADTIWWLGMIDSPISIIPGLIAALFYAQYRINRGTYEATQQELERRRLADAGVGA